MNLFYNENQYILQIFFEMFHVILTDNNHLINESDPLERLQIIKYDLFQMIYTRIVRGMLYEDRIVLALLLTKIHLKTLNNELNYDEEYDLLIENFKKYQFSIFNGSKVISRYDDNMGKINVNELRLVESKIFLIFFLCKI